MAYPNSAKVALSLTQTPHSSGMPTTAQASIALASSPPVPMPKEPVGPQRSQVLLPPSYMGRS
ncbi:hypothetical protein EHI44_26785 [Rhizobium leguminosarum]|nr:hypothetical protein [Rhizobium leguminosarum]RWY81559.1 hypothetical protein EHI44_26785 [Rhizobium leguminosarum]